MIFLKFSSICSNAFPKMNFEFSDIVCCLKFNHILQIAHQNCELPSLFLLK